jgi:hypothetical protein
MKTDIFHREDRYICKSYRAVIYGTLVRSSPAHFFDKQAQPNILSLLSYKRPFFSEAETLRESIVAAYVRQHTLYIYRSYLASSNSGQSTSDRVDHNAHGPSYTTLRARRWLLLMPPSCCDVTWLRYSFALLWIPLATSCLSLRPGSITDAMRNGKHYVQRKYIVSHWSRRNTSGRE